MVFLASRFTSNTPRGRGIGGGMASAVAFSQAAYDGAGERPEVINGYVYDTELSNKRNAVYYDPINKKVVVAFRGTDFTDPADLYQDFRIMTGTFYGTSRIETGKQIVKDAAEKYNVRVEDVALRGHSLGSSVAQAVGSELKIKDVAVFNPGSSPIELITGRPGAGYGRVYSTGIDPISITNLAESIGGGNVRYSAPGVEPHGLSNFEGN